MSVGHRRQTSGTAATARLIRTHPPASTSHLREPAVTIPRPHDEHYVDQPGPRWQAALRAALILGSVGDKLPMRPSSVLAPVAVTTATARPAAMVVPRYTSNGARPAARQAQRAGPFSTVVRFLFFVFVFYPVRRTLPRAGLMGSISRDRPARGLSVEHDDVAGQQVCRVNPCLVSVTPHARGRVSLPSQRHPGRGRLAIPSQSNSAFITSTTMMATLR